MHKTFGNTASFAIECIVDQVTEERILLGKTCLWIDGKRVGDINEHIHLLAGPYTTLMELYELLNDPDNNSLQPHLNKYWSLPKYELFKYHR